MARLTLGALILAGGKNTRMSGSQKALLLDSHGTRFLDHLMEALDGFEEKLISTNTPSLAQDTGFSAVADRQSCQGPLGGLVSALSVCHSDALITVACDMPLFTKELAHYLASFSDRGWPAWALRDHTDRLHPLCGVYTKQCLPAMEAALAAGDRRMGMLFQRVQGQALSLQGTSFGDEVLYNVNTPQELEALLKRPSL